MIYLDVDTAVAIPVSRVPLVSSADFITIDETIAYNESGMDLNWNFVTSAGVTTQTHVTPTTGGDYDWTHVGNGVYKIEIPASGGASINNDTEGYGWFSGVADGVLPFVSEVYCFRAAILNDIFCDVATVATNLSVVFNTDFATNYDATNDVWVVDTSGVSVTTTGKDTVMFPPGQPFPSVRYATDDTAALLTAAGDDVVNGRQANWAVIQCYDASNDARVAFDETPTQGSDGIGITLSNKDKLVLTGRALIEQCSFISAASGAASALQVTFGYNPKA